MKPAASPPFELGPRAVSALAELLRLVGRYEGLAASAPQPQLRRQNRIRTVRASVAIEGNTLGEDRASAILDGKHVVGPPREIPEVRNASEAYARAQGVPRPAQDSTATASRDLRDGVAGGALSMEGTKALARYCFRAR